MKLLWGDTETLGSHDWAQIELHTNTTSDPMQIEGIMIRAALWGRRFDAFELYAPVERVEASGMELMVPNLFARVVELDQLAEMISVWGIDGLARDRSGQVLRIPDTFVQDLVDRERKTFERPIRLGDFVRILWGPERMLCGEVRKLQGRRATVSVEMRSRRLVTQLPIAALQPLSSNEVEYFYRGD